MYVFYNFVDGKLTEKLFCGTIIFPKGKSMQNRSFNILIVEDEYINAKFIEQIVSNKGHSVAGIVANADDAITLIKDKKPDLIFMDINIEGATDGIQCASLLNQKYNIPVIYMTAYGDAQTIEEASDTRMLGYIIKPFDTADVEAALAVAIKMINEFQKPTTMQHSFTCIELEHNYVYDFEAKSLKIDNIHVELTNKETLLLHLFCRNINHNISYDLLLECVWKNHAVTNSTIRDTISRLRKKAPLLKLENIPGVGYRLSKS